MAPNEGKKICKIKLEAKVKLINIIMQNSILWESN